MEADFTLSQILTLGWVHDLFNPACPGKWHTRKGYCIEVAQEHFECARRELAGGAKEVYFEAQRIQPFNGAYYALTKKKSLD